MAEQFGCCHKYKECSNYGSCLYAGDSEFAGCQYRRNLEQGKNFYPVDDREVVLFTVRIGSRHFETGKNQAGHWFSRAVERKVESAPVYTPSPAPQGKSYLAPTPKLEISIQRDKKQMAGQISIFELME